MDAISSLSMESAERSSQISYPVVDTSEITEISCEIVAETSSIVVDDKIYVAVGKNLKENLSTLQWVIQNSGGRHICILHVHQRADKIPLGGILYTHQITEYYRTERQQMLQLLDKYRKMCQKEGVNSEVKYIEKDSIEKGIIELILKHNIRNLVMGAAADKQYSRKMVDLKSKKAIYVRLNAPVSCQIQFICKGHIIFTREGQNTTLQSDSPAQDYHRVMSDNSGTRISTSSSNFNESTLASRLNSGRVSDEWGGTSQRSPSNSRFSTCSSEMVDDSGLITLAITEGGEIKLPRVIDVVQIPSPPIVLQERGMDDEFYDQLEQAMTEAENAKREAFEESIRRTKAEKDAIDAKRRAKAYENLYAEELRRRQELNEILEKTKEENVNSKNKLDDFLEELRLSREHNSFLESQIADFDHTVQELKQKMFSAVELLQNYKNERDELQIECDDALKLVEEMRLKQAEEIPGSSVSQLYTEFDFLEVKDATRNFDPFLKIGEGGYGSTFKGFLRHTEVSIKMLHLNSLQGPSEFHQEVNVLSKLSHPNVIKLIGACPEAWIIIYEYLSGGSLEDLLNCKYNTPPLSWQNRIRIAAELCSVLSFLHSCGIVHGNLNPDNILLDKNLVTKLSDVGICRELSRHEFSSNYEIDPRGTFIYMDPEFHSTGEFTSKSDTYSFGIILLRLLTGKPALGLTEEVQNALNEKNLKNILDQTAGDWPFVQAQQLARLAMNCCDVISKNRPDLASEVWRVLEPMRVSCGIFSFRLGSERQSDIPHYFLCPIFQEIMQDPVVAADGFTYEAEAIKGWLDSGHNNSPMTNLQLVNSNLVPNKALRSAIQEWLQQS